MKKVSVVGRWPLAVGRWPLAVGLSAGAVSLSATAHDAHAGRWEMIQVPLLPNGEYATGSEVETWRGEVAEYFGGTVSGKKHDEDSRGGWPLATIESPVAPHTFAEFHRWYESTNNITNNLNGGGGLYAGSTGGPAEAKAEGFCRSRLKWTRDHIKGPINGDGQQTYIPDPNDNPPPYTYIKVKVRCSSSLNDEGEEFGEMKADVTPGSGAILVEDLSSPFITTAINTKNTVKVYLVKVETGGSDLIWTPKFTFDAKSVLLGDRVNNSQWRYGQAAVGVSYEPEMEDFTLRVSRDFNEVLRDGNPSLDKTKDSWIEADGTRHGHTIYSSKTREISGVSPDEIVVDVKNSNKVSIGVSRGSGWGSNPTFQWNPANDGTTEEAADTIDFHEQIMPDGGMIFRDLTSEWIGTPNVNPVEKIFSYKVTNNTTAPSISETTQYKLHLHDEWEVKEVIRDDGRVVINRLYPSVVDSSNPIYDPQSTPAPLTRKYAYSEEATATSEQSHKTTKDASFGFSLGIDASKSKLSPFLSKAGIDLSAKGEANIAAASESKRTQLNSTGFSYSLTPEIVIGPGQYSKPKINVWAYRKVYKLRHWSAGGFLSDSEMTVTEFDAYEPRWEELENLPESEGGPGGGDPS